MIFKSDLTSYAKLTQETLDSLKRRDRLKSLPQLYRASLEFAQAQNDLDFNTILRHVKLTGKYKHISIDSRSHMLMKGMYPCIPGWHCDDFYRTEELNNQPDLDLVSIVAPAIHHIIILGDCSRTEFLSKDIFLPGSQEVKDQFGMSKPFYYQYDKMIEELNPPTIHLEEGTIYTFGPTAFHRGQEAQSNGWRYFIRITESNHYEPKNEIRYQTQVYTKERVSW